MTLHSCIQCAEVLRLIWEGQNNLYILFKFISLLSAKKKSKTTKQTESKKQSTKTKQKQQKRKEYHHRKRLNSMYGAVPTWNSLNLLKFSYAGCLSFSRFYLKISKEVTDFITWWCWSCLCSKILELLYPDMHIRLVSLLSAICKTFENKTHTGMSRTVSIAQLFSSAMVE